MLTNSLSLTDPFIFSSVVWSRSSVLWASGFSEILSLVPCSSHTVCWQSILGRREEKTCVN
jgi:hypothetical protein